MLEVDTWSYWGYMTPHLAAAVFVVLCAIELWCHKRTPDEFEGTMDRSRPMGPFLAIGCALPLYTTACAITTVVGGVSYGKDYYGTLPGVLGFVPFCIWLWLFLMVRCGDEIDALWRKITCQKPKMEVIDDNSKQISET